MKSSVNLEGLAQLDGILKSLGDEKSIKKSARSSLRKGAEPIRKTARDGAKRIDDPKTSEMIYKNIAIRAGGARAERSVGGAMVRVGVLGGARDMSKHGEFKGAGKSNPGGDTFYWRFHEFGTSRMAARPFMQPAISQNVSRATDLFVQQFNLQVDRMLKNVP